MKTIAAMILSMFVVLSSAFAGEPIGGKTFVVNYESNILDLSFTQKPFGPNEQGTMAVSMDGKEIGYFEYEFVPDLQSGLIENQLPFFIKNDTLYILLQWLEGKEK